MRIYDLSIYRCWGCQQGPTCSYATARNKMPPGVREMHDLRDKEDKLKRIDARFLKLKKCVGFSMFPIAMLDD